MHPITPIEKFGKSHWSLLLFMETLVVDSGGRLKYGEPRLSQAVLGSDLWRDNYNTQLNDGTYLEFHDDWDCLMDLTAAGLLSEPRNWSGAHVYALTDFGWLVAGQLRRWKAESKGIAAYVAPLNNTTIAFLPAEALLSTIEKTIQISEVQVGDWLFYGGWREIKSVEHLPSGWTLFNSGQPDSFVDQTSCSIRKNLGKPATLIS